MFNPQSGINSNTFGMGLTPPIRVQKAVFDWSMTFSWAPNWPPKDAPDLPWKKEFNTRPILSPAMAGGLLAIKKSFFEHLGTYDNEMKVWKELKI